MIFLTRGMASPSSPLKLPTGHGVHPHSFLVYHRATVHIDIQPHTQFPVHLTSISLDCGMKEEHMEETNKTWEEHAKLHTERPQPASTFKSRSFLLWNNTGGIVKSPSILDKFWLNQTKKTKHTNSNPKVVRHSKMLFKKTSYLNDQTGH